MNDDPLVEEGLVKPAADTNEADEPFLIYLLYHQADLICMGVDHDRWALPLFRGYEVAKLVHSHLVHIRRDLILYNPLH